MNEILERLLDAVRALVRFRWTALLVATLVSFGGWAYVYQLQDVYEGRARVFVDSNRVLGPLLKGLAVQPNVQQRVSLMSRTLLNRPNLEKLIRTADLGTEAVTELERERLLNGVRSRITLSGTRGNASLYNVSYRDSERERARRVVQALLNIFIEETIGDKRQDSQTAQEFLDQQIAILERRLADSERRLSEFKRENSGKTPGEAGGYYARLEDARSRSRATRLGLAEARNRAELLAQRVARESPTLRGDAVLGASPTQLKLRARRDELDALLVRYTERHPRVSQLRATIAALETQAEAERENPPGLSSSPGAPLIANPTYQQMRAGLTEAEARVAELEVRVLEYDRQVEELETTVESIPRIEAQLQQLDRDYEVVRTQYETLLQRRESARLSDDVEQNVDDIQFRVIDPPFVPVLPSAPKKWLLSAGVFAASLVAGAAVALALSLLRPVYYAPETVAARTGRVPLGSVSRWLDSRDRVAAKVGWIAYVGALGTLALLCLLVVMVQKDVLDVARIGRATGLPLGDWAEGLGRAVERAVDAVKRLVGGRAS